jgi:hypothetical protein
VFSSKTIFSFVVVGYTLKWWPLNLAQQQQDEVIFDKILIINIELAFTIQVVIM